MSVQSLSSQPIPFNLARAYGLTARPVAAVAPVRQVQGADAAAPIGRISPAVPTQAPGAAQRAEAINLLVGAVVPGKIDFSGAAPAQRDEALPFYRRPGDLNEAAVAIRMGRSVDVEG